MKTIREHVEEQFPGTYIFWGVQVAVDTRTIVDIMHEVLARRLLWSKCWHKWVSTKGHDHFTLLPAVTSVMVDAYDEAVSKGQDSWLQGYYDLHVNWRGPSRLMVYLIPEMNLHLGLADSSNTLTNKEIAHAEGAL
ncbi:hypothetical protein WJX72_002949 [[Myrmecia] bisecta]|uniref:Uncharacterized protein n=1 Tax=[Myrmecia] bisecta TaxID=41462 RepID=A0AAW1R5M9_9CHLO